jgi:hypothetical protein
MDDLSTFERAELEALRAFFAEWEAMHACPKDHEHQKRKAQEHASVMVGHAQTIRQMHGSMSGLPIINGLQRGH